jgi:hypothetical protein
MATNSPLWRFINDFNGLTNHGELRSGHWGRGSHGLTAVPECSFGAVDIFCCRTRRQPTDGTGVLVVVDHGDAGSASLRHERFC